MLKLTVEVSWRNSHYGYLIGIIFVRDENDKTLMLDEDMYYSMEKLQKRLNSLFLNNSRFRWDNATYHRKSRKLVITGVDLKGAKTNE